MNLVAAALDKSKSIKVNFEIEQLIIQEVEKVGDKVWSLKWQFIELLQKITRLPKQFSAITKERRHIWLKMEVERNILMLSYSFVHYK